MFRLITLLALLPTVAAAEWSPRPAMFDYAATFDLCTSDPQAPTLDETCSALLTSAYALKRAVARSTFTCGPQDLAICARPFEDEGLPHIAMRIALDVGCDATRWDDTTQAFASNDCVTVASDIMIDEGVVPVLSELYCDTENQECSDLAQINATLWRDAVTTQAAGLGKDQDPNIALRIENATIECEDRASDTNGWDASLIEQKCQARLMSALWSELAARNQ